MELLLYIYLLLLLIMISYLVTNIWFLGTHFERWILRKLKGWYSEYKYNQALGKIRTHLKSQGFTDEEIERKIVIAQLRSHLAFFGHDVSDLTDEEIEQGVMKISKILASAGPTVDEAAIALSESLAI